MDYHNSTFYKLPRDKLLDRIAGISSQVILIDAPAGTGKSWLLEELSTTVGLSIQHGIMPTDRVALWDVPHMKVTSPLPNDISKLIIAKRPSTAVPGLARAEVYGKVTRLTEADLLFDAREVKAGYDLSDAEAEAIIAKTGGWPCLMPCAQDRASMDASIFSFLRDDLLHSLPSVRIVALDAMLRGKTVDPAALQGIPFLEKVDCSSQLPILLPAPLAACASPLRRAISEVFSERSKDPTQARAIATALVSIGELPEAITLFQSIGAWQAAIETLRQAGGLFTIHLFGPEALDKILAGFPSEMARQDELIVHCRAIQAIKRGDARLTHRILRDCYGDESDSLIKVLDNSQRYSREFRLLRFILQTWEENKLDSLMLDKAYQLMGELPADDDLRRGAIYNSVLEVYIRARRFAEADHTAVLADVHFSRANVPILSFYIDLHRAIIQLLLGDARTARKRAASAAIHLSQVTYDSPGDARLFDLLNACIAYEEGEAEPLRKFLSSDLDDLASGETTPTLIELALIYGSQALTEQYSTVAARSFLDRWRVRQERSDQFGMLISIREILVLQNGNRWQEAMVKAAGLDTRISLEWVEENGLWLATMEDRDEIAIALAWLRYLAQVTPTRPLLERWIGGMLDNPHLTGRQRIGAEVWLAHVLHRQRRLPEAQAQLRKTLSTVASFSSIATLSEERIFLAELISTRRMKDGLERNDILRRLLRQVQDAGPGSALRGKALGLTRQETRILHSLSDGATNKMIANIMGLSEATIKFHLSNLYRKLGCANRNEAIKSAERLLIIS
jgi:DNA-binding CsgD family transcriptional regulator